MHLGYDGELSLLLVKPTTIERFDLVLRFGATVLHRSPKLTTDTVSLGRRCSDIQGPFCDNMLNFFQCPDRLKRLCPSLKALGKYLSALAFADLIIGEGGGAVAQHRDTRLFIHVPDRLVR